MIAADHQTRATAALSGRRLEYFTIVWNLMEGIISLLAGILAGSISLVGFGVDSFIEVASGTIILWRMTVDRDTAHRERNEELALRLVGFSFLGLAGCLVFQSVIRFADEKTPQPSTLGMVIAALSLIVMPLLSSAKREVARRLGSLAMAADAKQTDFCAYLSAILLAGLLLNFAYGWWWADPVAALIMAAIIGNEGINSSLGKKCCD
jgi:divalent metal cation (Fe/Co/Zn/Cd) transporter